MSSPLPSREDADTILFRIESPEWDADPMAYVDQLMACLREVASGRLVDRETVDRETLDYEAGWEHVPTDRPMSASRFRFAVDAAIEDTDE